MRNERKVLVVEDEKEYQTLVHEILRDSFEVILSDSAEEAIDIARIQSPDIILLDIRIPQTDGVSLCEQLRICEKTQHIPILMLTASRDVESRVKAFSAGADDFITKPFTESELRARIESKFRRIQERSVKKNLKICGNLTLDLNKIEVNIEKQKIPLTLLEFNLLKFFIENTDKVLSRKDILIGVWQGCVITDRTVDSHIASLRKKLKSFNRTIATVHGSGFILKK